MIFSSKETTLKNQALSISTSLASLEELNTEAVEQVMDFLDIQMLTRSIVTDENGKVLYDSNGNDADGSYVLFSEVALALEYKDVFFSKFESNAFQSSAAIPVVYHGALLGAVYIYEYDTEQAQLLSEVQAILRNISFIVGIFALIMSVILSKLLTRRIEQILSAIKVVREGNYDYRMEISGRDELAELGNEFNIMTGQLQKTEVMRRRFVSDTSHELKTPLAAITLLTDSILNTPNMDVDTLREFVGDIGSEADRLSRMTEKLLQLTRLDNKVMNITTEVDVLKVAKTVVHTLEPLASSGNILIELSGESGCFVTATEDEIHQVLFNLVENAVKYNRRCGRVEVKVYNSSGGITVVSVDDTGVGIPDDEWDKIFERFYRVGSDRSRETGGTGLGLSIVRDTVAKYMGTIEVSKSKLGGMRFEISFAREDELK